MVCSVNCARNFIKCTARSFNILGRGKEKNTNILKIIAFLFGKYKHTLYLYIIIIT